MYLLDLCRMEMLLACTSVGNLVRRWLDTASRNRFSVGTLEDRASADNALMRRTDNMYCNHVDYAIVEREAKYGSKG